MLDKKLTELHTEASSQIIKTKNADLESKAFLESKVAQIEKDYISKIKHENILTGQLLDLKSSHSREIRELEERLETNYNLRVKDIVNRVKNECKNELQELKGIYIIQKSLIQLQMKK